MELCTLSTRKWYGRKKVKGCQHWRFMSNTKGKTRSCCSKTSSRDIGNFDLVSIQETTRIKRGWKETEVWKTSWEAVYETEEKDTRCCQRCGQEKTKQVDPHRSARVKPPRPISDQPPLPQKPTWLTYETQGWSGLYFISAGFSVMGQ